VSCQSDKAGNDFTVAFSASVLYNFSLLSGSIETNTNNISGDNIISSAQRNFSKNSVTCFGAFQDHTLSSGIHLQIISFFVENSHPHWRASASASTDTESSVK
jgi:hypothetical protein